MFFFYLTFFICICVIFDYDLDSIKDDPADSRFITIDDGCLFVIFEGYFSVVAWNLSDIYETDFSVMYEGDFYPI